MLTQWTLKAYKNAYLSYRLTRTSSRMDKVSYKNSNDVNFEHNNNDNSVKIMLKEYANNI